MEQKCKSSSPSRMGMESVSSTCMPQIGSRTSRRVRFVVCGSPDEFARVCGTEALCNRERKTRRSSLALQEITSNQNRNRTMRARNVIGSKTVYRAGRSEEHTSELQSQSNLVCRLLLENNKKQL